MSRFIYIGKEGFRVESEAHFANILEEKLGRDAAELFNEYISERDCRIEELEEDVDKLRKISKHYDLDEDTWGRDWPEVML